MEVKSNTQNNTINDELKAKLKQMIESKEQKDDKNVNKDQNEILKEKEKIINDYTSQLQRLQAEFENFQKRTDKEKLALIKLANKNVIQKLLNIKDDFERAFATKKTDDTFTQGVSMILSAFNKLLTEEGVEPIPAKGLKFDPYKHEALLQEESNLPDDYITEELQKGYVLNGEVIRPAKVKISKKKKEAEKKEDSKNGKDNRN